MALTPEGGRRKWERSFEEWVKACQKKHNHKFEYPTRERTKDKFGRWKIEIICPDHGAFFQAPEKHKFGQGCPYCSGNRVKESHLDFLKRVFPEEVWPEKGEYTAHSKIIFECVEHGLQEGKVNDLKRKHTHGDLKRLVLPATWLLKA